MVSVFYGVTIHQIYIIYENKAPYIRLNNSTLCHNNDFQILASVYRGDLSPRQSMYHGDGYNNTMCRAPS